MSKTVRKIGANINMNAMVIHQVSKVANDRYVSVKMADKVIDVKEKEQVFIGKLSKAYYKKSNPTYGIFGDEDPTFKNLLSTYIDTADFYSFSAQATEYYRIILQNTISATGGFLMFADFVNTDISDRYLLVLTTNNKDGYMVSDDLKIQDIKNIDLSKVDIACMINLTKWEDIDNGVDTDTKTYLSFVKGNKNISYYFLSYIDCNNKTTNTESTKRLTNALNEYAKEKAYDRSTTIKKRNVVYQYCDDCLKTKKEIQLSAISALLGPESPEEFSEFASDEKYSVSETIKGDRAQLRKMKYIMYADEKYRLEFDSDLLGKEVVYNRQKNELTFKKLPEDLIKQIPQ